MDNKPSPFTPVFVACVLAVLFVLVSDFLVMSGQNSGALTVMVSDAFARFFGKICTILCLLRGGVLFVAYLRDAGIIREVAPQLVLALQMFESIGQMALSWLRLKEFALLVAIAYLDLIIAEIKRLIRK